MKKILILVVVFILTLGIFQAKAGPVIVRGNVPFTINVVGTHHWIYVGDVGPWILVCEESSELCVVILPNDPQLPEEENTIYDPDNNEVYLFDGNIDAQEDMGGTIYTFHPPK